MPKVKTADLTGAALDWAVAKCEGLKPYVYNNQCVYRAEPHGGGIYFRPSTDWAQGGPIIEREQIATAYYDPLLGWAAFVKGPDKDGVLCKDYFGPTPLIAAMRCYVASKRGDEVDVPQELL